MSQRDKPRQGVVGNMQKLFRVRSSSHGKIDCHSGKRVLGGTRIQAAEPRLRDYREPSEFKRHFFRRGYLPTKSAVRFTGRLHGGMNFPTRIARPVLSPVRLCLGAWPRSQDALPMTVTTDVSLSVSFFAELV
jgi:hypothetical protein